MLQPVPWLALALALGVSPAVASAQETRASVLEQQRAERATALRPYEPGKIEKALRWYEEANLLGRINPHDGLFVRYGYTGRPIGAGMGFGAGWRHDLFGRRVRVELESGITLRNYRLLRVDVSAPYLAGERVELGFSAIDRHHPQEDFFGIGPESVDTDRASFLADYRDYQARAVARPKPWLVAAVRTGRLSPSIGPGTDKRYPVIGDRFTDFSAPGLLEQPEYAYHELSAAVDYRDQDGNARAGGYYGFRWRTYSDDQLHRYGFRELDAHVQQFFPIFDKKRVIALQARLIGTNAAAGQQVPFYMKPTLGGSTTLRSVSDYRFRDDNVIYLNAEYRWEALSGVDMALFSDWGTVAPSLDAVRLANLKHGYGIGFRFNTYKSVWLRIDLATGGGEGLRYFFKFGKAF